MGAVLELQHISKLYPGVRALDDVSISFRPGEVHAVMGENGAGKSTLIKIIAGAIRPDAGTILMDGVVQPAMTPAKALELGISVVYQELNLAYGLSAAENIFMGKKLGGKVFQDFGEMRRRTQELFARFGMDVDPEAKVGDLPNSQRQLVEIAKAVSRDVRILILDEPSSALATHEVDIMLDMVRRLRSEGVCVIYISHRMDEIFQIADSITVLRDGRFVDSQPASELDRPKLISRMVGRELAETFPENNFHSPEVVLDVRDLSGNGVEHVSFQLHRSEILGLAGLVGSGRTELAKVIFGAARRTGGEILCNGVPLEVSAPSEAIRAGIGLIPEDRKREGVFLGFPIDWNISLISIRSLCRHGIVQRKRVKALSEEYFAKLRIKAPSEKSLVRNLSGGNQQKVALAKTLASRSSILIFDEPTRGIDVGAKQEIYKLMSDLAKEGISIIMISSEMEELLGMSDRILVMHENHLAGELKRREFSQENVLALASGITKGA